MFDRTITVFNYKKDTGKWHGTVLTHVTFAATDGAASGSRGTNNSSHVSISIRCTKNRVLKGSIQYFHPLEYQNLDSVDEAITFTPEVDFMVLDEAMSQLDYIDDDYEDGLYHYLNMTKTNVFMITDATFYSLIPHFVVTGR